LAHLKYIMAGTIDFYVASLPIRGGERDDDGNTPDHSFLQCCVYADKVHPIKEVGKWSFINTKLDGDTTESKSKFTDTYSLWSIITGLLDSSHHLGNPSMQRCNVRFVTDSLKAYCSDKTILTFLTSRRIYPLMELLDKPKVEFEKKHQNAIGYFLSFLLDKAVTINNTAYRWTTECLPSDIQLAVKNGGVWKQV
jgi:hypothetical protein